MKQYTITIDLHNNDKVNEVKFFKHTEKGTEQELFYLINECLIAYMEHWGIEAGVRVRVDEELE